MRNLAWGILALLVVAGSVWGILRDRVGRSVLEHQVIEVLQTIAAEESWALLMDEIQRPGMLEPLWLAGMMGEPWRRTLIFRTHNPPAWTGPLVEDLLFGESGGPPEVPVDGVVWRTSRTFPSLPIHASIEAAGGGPRGTFVGYADELTFLDRARRLQVALDGDLVVVIVEGGARQRGGDGFGHPLQSTTPLDWGTGTIEPPRAAPNNEVRHGRPPV